MEWLRVGQIDNVSAFLLLEVVKSRLFTPLLHLYRFYN